MLQPQRSACSKSGVRIIPTTAATTSKKPRQLHELDLDLSHYSETELCTLFGVQGMVLTPELLKECRKLALKTHPDKSKLDGKYFEFFNRAYQQVVRMYEFQNKSTSKTIPLTTEEFLVSEGDTSSRLTQLFQAHPDLKDNTDWFNEQFEKHRLEDDALHVGYGTWLTSNEDVSPPSLSSSSSSSSSSMQAMNQSIEDRKRQLQVQVHRGVQDMVSTRGGSSLQGVQSQSNFTSGHVFSAEGGLGYTDLKQAYVESVIPVTEDEFYKRPQFRSVEEFQRHRDSVDTSALSKQESMRLLQERTDQEAREAQSLAYYHAQQDQRVQDKSALFWSSVQHLTNTTTSRDEPQEVLRIAYHR